MIGATRGEQSGRTGIVGLGLVGGSLARSLKALPSPPHIRALSLEPVDLEAGLAARVIDEAMIEPDGFFEGLDLLVYCTPLNATLHLLEAHRDLLDPETLITDVVSLKAPIMERVKRLDLHASFVGSHPMAGGEGRGFRASREGLFIDARVWIVPGGAPEVSVVRVEEFWASLGARGVRVAAEEHDERMVWVSHLPQLTANALALVLCERGIGRKELGPGGQAMTRLAGSAPEMWRDLLEHAPGVLPEAMAAVEHALSDLRNSSGTGDWEMAAELMRRTRSWFEGES